ncbi:hypothetical protein F4779DRAFT_232298 [Xylariaceae sp. FL0662B]|nr:hypothetical protein F4779DRAFT_232298 [Xylariaceae sp. FL0662B]
MALLLHKRQYAESRPSMERHAWALAVTSVVVFGMRIWCRCRGTRRLWWDDYLLAVSLIFLIANAAMFSLLLRVMPVDPNPQFLLGSVYLYSSLANTFNPLAQVFSKSSVAISLLRVTNGLWKRSLLVGMFVTNGLLLAQLWITWIHDCNEDTGAYELPGSCYSNEYAVWVSRIVTIAISVVFDLFLTLLPWKIVNELRLNLYEKIGLAFSMGLGAFAGVAGIARLILWIQFVMIPSSDIFYFELIMFLWNFIEPAATIIAASVAMFRVLGRDLVRWSNSTLGLTRLFSIYTRKPSQNLQSDNPQMSIIPGQRPIHNSSAL